MALAALWLSLVAALLAFPAATVGQGFVTDPLHPEPPESAPPQAQPEPDLTPQPEKRGRTAGPRRRVLSNERTRSRWAYVLDRTWARVRPTRHSKRVKLLHTTTPDGTAELVLALSEYRTRGGGRWVKVRLPMRPNNRTGWVRRSRIGRYRLVRTFLRVNRRTLRAALYRGGRRIWRSRIGVGQSRWPTPGGRFYVRDRLVPADPSGLYGVFAFGLSAYSETLTDWPGGGMIGVHGTNQPQLIPGRISHGCVRVPNARIARLRRLMPLGTPVLIR